MHIAYVSGPPGCGKKEWAAKEFPQLPQVIPPEFFAKSPDVGLRAFAKHVLKQVGVHGGCVVIDEEGDKIFVDHFLDSVQLLKEQDVIVNLFITEPVGGLRQCLWRLIGEDCVDFTNMVGVLSGWYVEPLRSAHPEDRKFHDSTAVSLPVTPLVSTKRILFYDWTLSNSWSLINVMSTFDYSVAVVPEAHWTAFTENEVNAGKLFCVGTDAFSLIPGGISSEETAYALWCNLLRVSAAKCSRLLIVKSSGMYEREDYKVEALPDIELGISGKEEFDLPPGAFSHQSNLGIRYGRCRPTTKDYCEPAKEDKSFYHPIVEVDKEDLLSHLNNRMGILKNAEKVEFYDMRPNGNGVDGTAKGSEGLTYNVNVSLRNGDVQPQCECAYFVSQNPGRYNSVGCKHTTALIFRMKEKNRIYDHWDYNPDWDPWCCSKFSSISDYDILSHLRRKTSILREAHEITMEDVKLDGSNAEGTAIVDCDVSYEVTASIKDCELSLGCDCKYFLVKNYRSYSKPVGCAHTTALMLAARELAIEADLEDWLQKNLIVGTKIINFAEIPGLSRDLIWSYVMEKRLFLHKAKEIEIYDAEMKEDGVVSAKARGSYNPYYDVWFSFRRESSQPNFLAPAIVTDCTCPAFEKKRGTDLEECKHSTALVLKLLGHMTVPRSKDTHPDNPEASKQTRVLPVSILEGRAMTAKTQSRPKKGESSKKPTRREKEKKQRKTSAKSTRQRIYSAGDEVSDSEATEAEAPRDELLDQSREREHINPKDAPSESTSRRKRRKNVLKEDKDGQSVEFDTALESRTVPIGSPDDTREEGVKGVDILETELMGSQAKGAENHSKNLDELRPTEPRNLPLKAEENVIPSPESNKDGKKADTELTIHPAASEPQPKQLVTDMLFGDSPDEDEPDQLEKRETSHTSLPGPSDGGVADPLSEPKDSAVRSTDGESLIASGNDVKRKSYKGLASELLGDD